MARRGLNVPQLAQKTGIPSPSLYKYVTGAVEVPLSRFSLIRLALGVTPGEMFEGQPLTSIADELPNLVAA
jgi:hypothetical protein